MEATMKTLKCSLCVVLAAGFGFTAIMLLTRSPIPPAAEAGAVGNGIEGAQEVEPAEPGVEPPAPVATTPVRIPASAVPLAPIQTGVPLVDIAAEHSHLKRVRADRVLAKVNDQAIQLKHLVPLRSDEQEQAMTSEEYESRLNRAIEMELAFQAAAAQGVDLTPEQKRRVDGIAQRHESTLQEYKKQGVTWSSVTPEQIGFEQRLISALMLQQNLVAAEAHGAPASDPGVQARYEQSRSEVLSRLKANGNISVSTVEL